MFREIILHIFRSIRLFLQFVV